jgi:hypothetical protein
MPAPDPDFAEITRAIGLYLAQAYPGDPTASVRRLLATIENSSGDALRCPAFVPERCAGPTRYTLRLGNQFYPHMKLVLEAAPDESRFLYRADTHDAHIRPATTSPEYSAFCELMQKNQRIAEAIGRAWDLADIPTFKQYLREDILRRKAAPGTAPRAD